MPEYGQVDPSIPLSVIGGGSGPAQAGYTPSNPLALLQNIAKTRQDVAAAKLAQGQLAARQKLGQIMSQAPSMAEGLTTALSDPDVAGMVPDVVSNVAGAANTAQAYLGQKQSQAKDGFGEIKTILLSGIIDPDMPGKMLPAVLENTPDPDVRAMLSKSGPRLIEAMKNGLTPNPNNDPAIAEANKKKYLQNFTAIGSGTGSLDALLKFGGTAGTIVAPGGRQQGTLTAPTLPVPTVGGAAPGSVGTVGGSNALGIQPTLSSPEAITFEGGGGTGGGKTTNALGANRVPTTQPPTVAAAPQLAGNGKPLFPSGWDSSAPKSTTTNIGGTPVNQAGAIATNLANDFSVNGRKQYEHANAALGLLTEVDTNLDAMHQAGGFTVPGAAAPQRIDLAKLVNTLADMSGGSPVFDKNAIAGAEDLIKGTQRMGATLTNQFFGAQHTAAETFSNVTKAVPGISNTYLGGKLITALIRANTVRSMDQYDFENAWQNKHNGVLTGSDIAFNKLHPTDSYIKPVLDNYGLAPDGFKSLGSLEDAVKRGFLSATQAGTIAKQQGFELPRK